MDDPPMPRPTLVHPFALRPDHILHVELPLDLTVADVRRLQRWATSLEAHAVDAGAAAIPSPPAPALARLPSPAPAPLARPALGAGVPHVYWWHAGLKQRLDVLSLDGFMTPETSAEAIAQIVAGEANLFDYVAGAQTMAARFEGSYGGTFADKANAEIARAVDRVRTVVLVHLGSRHAYGNLPTEFQEKLDAGTMTLKQVEAVMIERKIPLQLEEEPPKGAPRVSQDIHVSAEGDGERVYRIAWCSDAKLEMSAAPSARLPAPKCVVKLRPVEPTTRLVTLWWAMWMGP